MSTESNIDRLFKVAKTTPVNYSLEETLLQFKQAATVQPAKKFTFKHWIMTLTSILGIGTAAFFLFQPTANKTIAKHEEQTLPTTAPKKEIVSNETHSSSFTHPAQPTTKSTKQLVVSLVLEPLIELSKQLEQEIEIQAPNTYFNNYQVNDDLPLPKLTEKEIVWAQKMKKQLLKSINKRDKKDWAYVPSGTFPFKESTVSCQSLFMLKYEVTNEQYLAFIYDLIIQERKADFQVAKPNQGLWTSFLKHATKFETHYFSHPVYQDYPVVNITVAGAQLFCDWLNAEYKKAYPKESDAINAVRLPQEAEWVMVASAIGKYSKFPWQGEYFRNAQGSVMANFVRTDLDPITDTIEIQSFDLTAPSKSYWPNDFGIYNLAGNVAEWVQVSTINNGLQTAATPISFRTIGGSFRNTEEFLRIHAKDPFEGVSAAPAIGFRIVMTHLGRM